MTHPDCWWTILHNGHFAWYQRALVSGDFKPGKTPRSEYIVDEDGREADFAATPKCTTCGEVPKVEDLEPVERVTQQRGYLDPYRSGREPWRAGTNDNTCFRCNNPAQLAVENPPLCKQCEAYLRENS